MNFGRRVFIIILISISCVGCDQSTKLLATEYLSQNGMHSYFYDIVRIGYTENMGGFLGFGNTLPIEYRFWLFSVAVGATLVGLLFYLIINSTQGLGSLIGLSLVFAGGFSNFYDRIANNGAVVDFVNIGLGPLRTGIFNVADVAILVGVGVVLLAQSKQRATT